MREQILPGRFFPPKNGLGTVNNTRAQNNVYSDHVIKLSIAKECHAFWAIPQQKTWHGDKKMHK